MTTRAKKRQGQKSGSFWELEEEDHLLHMDPNLMTERQQLAFLLRTTAHEASDGPHSDDDSSEDDAVTSSRPTKKPRRIQRADGAEHPTGTLTRRGPGRPPKNRKRPQSAKLRVMTQNDKEQHDKRLEAKPSPSGSDDVAHLDAARSFGQRTPRCALCCDYDTAYEASFSDALFLCPACDQKYPTQQALGRPVCMT